MLFAQKPNETRLARHYVFLPVPENKVTHLSTIEQIDKRKAHLQDGLNDSSIPASLTPIIRPPLPLFISLCR